jgi:hypothetical protein
MAVAHHPDELRDQQAFVHHDRHRLALGGEFDISNLDVLSTALRTLTAIGATGATGDALPAVPTLKVDLRQLEFLSVAAARTLDIGTAGYRRHGGRVELHHPSPHLITVLHLLDLHRLPRAHPGHRSCGKMTVPSCARAGAGHGAGRRGGCAFRIAPVWPPHHRHATASAALSCRPTAARRLWGSRMLRVPLTSGDW